MEPPGKRKARGADPGLTSAATKRISHEKPTATGGHKTVVAEAIRYVAAGEAQFDQLQVQRCPFCSYSHRHVAFETGTDVYERSPGCRRHVTYLVQVVRVVPLAPPLRERGVA